LKEKRDNPEARLALLIIKELRFKGHFCSKLKVKGGINPKGGFIKDWYACLGLPDLIAFTPKLAFIECKSKTGRQSEHQIVFQDRCRQAGIPYILARSFADVQTALNLTT
jgi:hypothetical protein